MQLCRKFVLVPLAMMATTSAQPTNLRGGKQAVPMNGSHFPRLKDIPNPFCDCVGGCAAAHCSQVKDIFEMIEWNRDGHGQGGVLEHGIGGENDVHNLLGTEPNTRDIDWLNDKSFGGSYYIINDCQFHQDPSAPSCSANAILRSDLLPIKFNHPDNYQQMHQIGLLFDPFKLDSTFYITDMYVLDGSSADLPSWQQGIPYAGGWGDHEPCEIHSGWDWPSNYDGSGHSYDASNSYNAMNTQCYFNTEQKPHMFGFWGNFIDARKSWERAARNGDTSHLPDESTYLEPEIEVYIKDVDAWNAMYSKALKAVTVQTNLCKDQLASNKWDAHCKDDDAEREVIRSAKLAACRVALQIKRTGIDVPVLEASFLTNSMVHSEKWDEFKDATGDHYTPASKYMAYYDCCWLLDDGYYDQLGDGWYDGECYFDGTYWKHQGY